VPKSGWPVTVNTARIGWGVTLWLASTALDEPCVSETMDEVKLRTRRR